MKIPEKIRRDWGTVQNTMAELESSISDTEVEYQEVASCLILAQKLNNQFDYIEQQYGISNEVVSEDDFKAAKVRRDELYKKLYEIFNKISNDEMISYIKSAIDDRMTKYQLQVTGIDKNDKEELLITFELRDEIKYLYDELDVWSGRWAKREERLETCDITDNICKEVGALDVEFRRYILAHKDKFEFLKKEAEKRLIVIPDGSKRFDYWWWFLLEA